LNLELVGVESESPRLAISDREGRAENRWRIRPDETGLENGRTKISRYFNASLQGAIITGMEGTESVKCRWFCPTPGKLVIGLLVVECLLWLSNWLGWPQWHKGYAVLTSIATVGAVLVLMLLWLVVALVFRRRFQFSIRTLLVLTVAVALPCSWMTVEMKRSREQQEAVEAIENFAGSVGYDWEYDADGNPVKNAQPSGPEWLRKLRGNDLFNSVVRVFFHSNQVTDEGLAHLAGLTQLKRLKLYHVTDAGLAHVAGLPHLQELTLISLKITDEGLTHLEGLTQLHTLEIHFLEVTDAGLAHLAGLTQLHTLEIHNPHHVTDAGLPHLAGLTRLQVLSLDHAQITDAGLVHLAGLTQLKLLHLSDTKITDAGLVHLAGLAQLLILDLNGTKVTHVGVQKLQQTLPNCEIHN
jgi:hypothetical protein